jgi:hypothetical protein
VKPGEVFEIGGRYWRVRVPDEHIELTDYHVGHADDWSSFHPKRTVQQDSISRNDRKHFQFVHEISALSYAMRKALERSKHHEQA